MDLIDDFIERKHGRAPIAYEHPVMERHLQETYGIMVYQEQVMRLAAELAGLTLGEADTLRKAMGKKDRELMAKQREKFVDGCKANRIDARKAERIWELIEKFAGYGFNKCLTAEACVELADGTVKPIIEVRPGDLVATKDGPHRTLGVRPSGVRPVGRLTLANGMSLSGTPDHPVFTQRGWVNVVDVRRDDFVAVARTLTCGRTAVDDRYPALLGYALSEGSLSYPAHFHLYSTSADELRDMALVLTAFANTRPRVEHRRDKRAASVRPARVDRSRSSEAVEFLHDLCALRGRHACDKRVPTLVDGWDERAIAVLVGKLFQGDGCVHTATRSVYYATSSGGLAEDVRRLLLKLGLSSTVHRKTFAYRGGTRAGFTVNLTGGRTAFRRFATMVGPHLVGVKQRALRHLVARYEDTSAVIARETVDVVPAALCLDEVRAAMRKSFPSLKAGCRALGVAYRLLFADRGKGGVRRDTLVYLAEKLDSPALAALAESPIAWSRPRSFTAEPPAATYDIEVPGAQSFIANGMVVHNSHATCYALVAYQTAYLKANYPTEYMAALLTSEMDRTEKIVQYVEESRAVGLRVEPPDVNRSRTQFTVGDGAIQFGLAAIKNVGVTAIDSIVRAREAGGVFATLVDFCARVDLRLVNRRVIEALIKAGGFDGLNWTRAGLLAALDQAMDAGQRRQRERDEGQVPLFDLGTADAPAGGPAGNGGPAAMAPEWPSSELLAHEKEVLGFYLSGHPLEEFRDTARRLGALSAADLFARPAGARVLLLGQVSALSESATKSGNRMGFGTLDLVDGVVPLTVFPEPYRAAAPALRHRGPVLVRGRTDDSDKGRVVLVDEVRPLGDVLAGGREAAPAAPPLSCRIRMAPAADDEGGMVASVRDLCRAHAGATPLFVHVLLPEQEVVIRSRGLSVSADPTLVAKIEALLGPGSILLEYGGRA
jgi:DNA polymerase-3 subunit alpha